MKFFSAGGPGKAHEGAPCNRRLVALGFLFVVRLDSTFTIFLDQEQQASKSPPNQSSAENSRSFDCVRLAPHFAQDDRTGHPLVY